MSYGARHLLFLWCLHAGRGTKAAGDCPEESRAWVSVGVVVCSVACMVIGDLCEHVLCQLMFHTLSSHGTSTLHSLQSYFDKAVQSSVAEEESTDTGGTGNCTLYKHLMNIHICTYLHERIT